MARKSPNQMALFDIAPEKKKQTKVKQQSGDMHVLVIYKDKKEFCHSVCPSEELEKNKSFYISRGCTKILEFDWDKYWLEFNKGIFSLGKPR